MEQKITWMHYLIIGISILFLLSISGCSKEVEYKLDTDIIYKNESNHIIRYYELVNNQKRQLFELTPNSEKIIKIRTSGGNENQTINTCCQGILADYQGDNEIFIDYDNNDKCITYTNGKGSTTSNIAAYESREIESGYYEFTYRFTEAEYNQAEDCN